MFDLLRESIINFETLVEIIESPFVSKIVSNAMRCDVMRRDTVNFHIEINCPFFGKLLFHFQVQRVIDCYSSYPHVFNEFQIWDAIQYKCHI